MTSPTCRYRQARVSSKFCWIAWIWLGSWLGSTASLPTAALAVDDEWEVNFIRSMGEQDRGHTDAIMNVRLLSGEEQALSCGKDGTVCLWDLASGKIVRRFTDDRFNIVYCIALLPDQRCFLAAGKGPGVVLWNLDTGQKLKEFDQTATIYSLSVFADQQSFICGDANGRISLHELTQTEPVKTWRVGSEDMTALIALPDQKGFITGTENGKVERWVMDQDKPVQEYDGLSNWTCCLQLSEDSQQLFGSDYSGNVVLWKTETAKQVWRQEKLSAKIPWGRFLEKQLLVVDINNAFFLIDRETGKFTSQPMVTGVAAGFDLDTSQSTFWSGGTQSILGWQVKTGKRIFPSDEAMPFVNGVQSLIVNNDRVYLLTKNGKNTSPVVIAWDLNTGQTLASLDIESSIPNSLAKNKPLTLIPLDCGLVVGTDSRLAVFDYETHALSFVKDMRSRLLRKSPNKNSLVFQDRDPSKLHEINLITNQTRLLLNLPDGNSVSDARFLDNHHMAITLDKYPQETELWSIDPAEMISKSAGDALSTIYAFSPDRLLTKGKSSELLVFASRQLKSSLLKPETLDQLLQDLDADDYAVREAATLELANGGEAVIKALENQRSITMESRIRRAKIARLVKDDSFPDLNRPLKNPTGISQSPQAIAIDPGGQLFVVSVNAGWKSELLICSIEDQSWSVVSQTPLRSRASQLASIPGKPGWFVVAFVDGTIDVIQIAQPRSTEKATATMPK